MTKTMYNIYTGENMKQLFEFPLFTGCFIGLILIPIVSYNFIYAIFLLVLINFIISTLQGTINKLRKK